MLSVALHCACSCVRQIPAASVHWRYSPSLSLDPAGMWWTAEMSVWLLLQTPQPPSLASCQTHYHNDGAWPNQTACRSLRWALKHTKTQTHFNNSGMIRLLLNQKWSTLISLTAWFTEHAHTHTHTSSVTHSLSGKLTIVYVQSTFAHFQDFCTQFCI